MISVLFEALQFGFQDSFSVCSLSSLSVFLIFFCRHSKSLKQVFSLTVLFSFGWTFTVLLLALGVADGILSRRFDLYVLCPLNAFLAIQFMWVGLDSFNQWYQLKYNDVSGTFKSFGFHFENDHSNFTLEYKVFSMLACFSLGVVMGILGNIAGQNYYFFALLIDRLTHPQGGIQNIFLMFSYMLGLSALVVFVITTAVWLDKVKKYSILVTNNISLFRMIHSAWYLSVGFGLIFFIIKFIKG